jgi:hypothetical protein
MKNKKSFAQPLVSIPPYRGDLLEYIKNKQEEDEEFKKNNKLSFLLESLVERLEMKFSKKNVSNEDLKSAFNKFWNSPVVRRKGKLISMPLTKTFSLNFKTLHSSNLSDGMDGEVDEKILETMKNPIVVLKYKYPDDDESKYYVLDGSHRYNEASTKNEYRQNPEVDYDAIPIYLVHLEESDKDLDPEFFKWVTEQRIPNGNWS